MESLIIPPGRILCQTLCSHPIEVSPGKSPIVLAKHHSADTASSGSLLLSFRRIRYRPSRRVDHHPVGLPLLGRASSSIPSSLRPISEVSLPLEHLQAKLRLRDSFQHWVPPIELQWRPDPSYHPTVETQTRHFVTAGKM